jgi:thiol-disulfide isomerase/thioredoxin
VNLAAGLLALIVLGSAAFASSGAALPAPPKGIRSYQTDMVSANATDFSLQNLENETDTLSNHKGHWVLLHFWASWCGPCRREMPEIQKLVTQFSRDKLAIIMINTAEDEDTVFSFLAETGLETGSLLDRDGRVTEAWKPRGLPTSFLIDPQGRVQFQAIGGRDWSNPAYLAFLRQLTGIE